MADVVLASLSTGAGFERANNFDISGAKAPIGSPSRADVQSAAKPSPITSTENPIQKQFDAFKAKWIGTNSDTKAQLELVKVLSKENDPNLKVAGYSFILSTPKPDNDVVIAMMQGLDQSTGSVLNMFPPLITHNMSLALRIGREIVDNPTTSERAKIEAINILRDPAAGYSPGFIASTVRALSNTQISDQALRDLVTQLSSTANKS